MKMTVDERNDFVAAKHTLWNCAEVVTHFTEHPTTCVLCAKETPDESGDKAKQKIVSTIRFAARLSPFVKKTLDGIAGRA